jgi:hypothetical protein
LSVNTSNKDQNNFELISPIISDHKKNEVVKSKHRTVKVVFEADHREKAARGEQTLQEFENKCLNNPQIMQS